MIWTLTWINHVVVSPLHAVVRSRNQNLLAKNSVAKIALVTKSVARGGNVLNFLRLISVEINIYVK